MSGYILHLETSTKVCSVALSFNGKCVALKEADNDGYMHSEQLTPFIQEVMSAANISYSQLSAVSVASGPGSYTGLRIGVSTAKGLCYALEIPLISVDALISLAFQATLHHSNAHICAMIDARRMEVFASIYDPELNILKPISADIIDENSYSEFEPFVCVGDATSKLIEIWASRPILMDTTLKASAKGQIELATKKFENKDFVDVAYFEPFYLKDFVGSQPKKS